MRLNQKCVQCMYEKQLKKNDNKEYLARIRAALDNRPEDITNPEMVVMFNNIYEKCIGPLPDYKDIKKKYNDLVLSMEADLREKIEAASDPLATSIVMARIGNYIDFGVLDHVDTGSFLKLFEDTDMRKEEAEVYKSFCDRCKSASSFLLLTDNCGEVVLDKLMLEQLRKRFPQLVVTIMVRGGDVLNDATLDDAVYVGLDKLGTVITNGEKIAGTVYKRLTGEAKKAVDSADVILSKGQANFEAFSGEGRSAFYTFLCKCDLFMERFNVPRFTGMFVEE